MILSVSDKSIHFFLTTENYLYSRGICIRNLFKKETTSLSYLCNPEIRKTCFLLRKIMLHLGPYFMGINVSFK